MTDLNNVTRLEVWVDNKRAINSLFGDIFTSVQDDGRTLKVWVDTSTSEQHTKEYLKEFGKWFDEFERSRVAQRTERFTSE